ncbi:MAG TPA: class I SAM-dependent methyltransferase [Solirubrobacterales bacterium]|nr:class I SAM-dependent methyltransferase [Solirubrobacterales bacterium]
MARDDFYASLFGAAYSTYMERPWLSRLVARLAWGADVAPYYASMAAIGRITAGGTVVDCPCGAGPALRALTPGQDLRYLAVDLSPAMLGRTEKKVRKRGLTQVELIRGAATAIPLGDDRADLFLSYWGLHCFEDPGAALVEAARVLKPGGRLVGSAILAGEDSRRQRLLVQAGKGDFGNPGTETEVKAWLEAAGFGAQSLRRSGPMLFFEAQLG